MPNSLELLLILLAVAVGVVVVCRIFQLPAMLGYLIVGILIGPHALGWIPDAPQTRYLAEFGVVFLMFSIGLEFSLPRLRAMQRLVFGLGSAQVVATVLLVMLASYFFGLDWRAGLALGGVLAMSSTAIVSKMLVERARTEFAPWTEHHGRAAVSGPGRGAAADPYSRAGQQRQPLSVMLGWALLKAAVVLAALLVFGQRLMRPWFHLVARQKSSELFMLNVLLITLGLAWLTGLAGLSLALGAFRGGHADLRNRIPLPGGRRYQAFPRCPAGPVLRHHRHVAGRGQRDYGVRLGIACPADSVAVQGSGGGGSGALDQW